jgi:DNA helicase-2/ATP-dependent DNA helicase PcrA
VITVSSNLFEGLDEHQMAAAKAPLGRHILVTAPPGSGKTRVLTARYAYLVAGGVDPSTIVAVTFTNKAADEMKSRIAAALGLAQEQVKKLPIATFHSLCARWLRRYAKTLGYRPNYSIYDQKCTRLLLKQIIEEREASIELAGLISFLKDHLVTPDKVWDAVTSGLLSRSSYRGVDAVTLTDVYKAYQRALKAVNAMDFDDLLLNTLALLDRIPLVRNLGIRYLLVDECQDINTAQYELIRKFASSGVHTYLVGDLEQSIYSFRGSRPDLIEAFIAEFEPEQRRLVYNYRSRRVIVDVSSEVIKANYARSKVIYVPMRAVKDGGKVAWYNVPPDVFEEEGDCASFPVRLVKGLVESGISPPDIAILCRYNRPLEGLWRECLEAGVPARLARTGRGLDTPIQHLLAVAVNPLDHISLEELLLSLEGIGPATTEKLSKALRGIADLSALVRAIEQVSLSSKYPPRVARSLERLAAAFHALQAGLMVPPAGATMATVLDGPVSMLFEAVQACIDYVDDTEILLRMAEQYPATHEGLLEFLPALSLVTGDLSQKKENLVTLSTIHSAKGLEYRIVVIVDYDEPLRVFDYSSPEERRIFYVAITRAIDRAYIVTRYRRSVIEDETMPCYVRDMLKGTGVDPVHLTNLFMCDMTIAEEADYPGGAQEALPHGKCWGNAR